MDSGRSISHALSGMSRDMTWDWGPFLLGLLNLQIAAPPKIETPSQEQDHYQ